MGDDQPMVNPAEVCVELRDIAYHRGDNFLRVAAGCIEGQQATIDRLTHQLQGVWAIANLLATRLETMSSGSLVALQEYDRALKEAHRG